MHYLYTNLEKKNVRTNQFIFLAIVFSLIISAFSPIFFGNKIEAASDVKMQTEKNLFNLVILGDSLAVGYEHGFTEQSKPFGIGEQLFEQALFQGYRTNYSNYGILGLRSEGLLRWLEAAKQNKTLTANQLQVGLKDPRVDKLLGETTNLYSDVTNANLIVLTIGGNDFLPVLVGLDLTKKNWTDAELSKVNEQINANIATYEANLQKILGLLQELNPKAQIVTQNQYLPLPKFERNGVSGYLIDIDKNLAKLLVEARQQINLKFDDILASYATKGLNIQSIDTVATIEENATNMTSILLSDIHPNALGYKKLSEQYSHLLWGEVKQVQPRKANIPLSVVVNGKEVISQYPTKLIQGRTYLVLRDITDAMGAQLKWNNKTQTATILLDNRQVELTINAKTYKVNGQTYTLNAEPAFIEKINKETKTYVPVAAISEGLGLFVEYRAQTKTVFVNP